jgi:hypothetical protein
VVQAKSLLVTGLLAIALLTTGCASRGKASIAEGARLVKSGTGAVEYTAKSAGTVYVLDGDDNRLIALGGIRPGQTARTDPAKSEVTINDKVITQHTISDKRHYQIYFRPDGDRSDR